MNSPVPTLIGRSSSHFTRLTRVFAHELGVATVFRPVFDLASLDTAAYGENPALKIPILVDERGPLFGSENICRALATRAGARERVVLRGDITDRAVANAEELTVHAMGAEVTLIMAGALGPTQPESTHLLKARKSLEGSLRYLNDTLDGALGALPASRTLSFLEVGLYCLVTHLAFRGVLDPSPFARLMALSDSFGARASAHDTEYRFDQAPTS